MPHLVICGDSFCVPDPDHAPMWAELLQQRCPELKITNLAQVGASNLLISAQVDRALTVAPTHIACYFTSSTRDSVRVAPSDLPLLDQHQSGALIPYAIPTCTTLEPHFTASEIDRLRRGWLEFRDLHWTIYLNSCVIERVLLRLQHSGLAWQWDQGGFEHPSFGGQARNYFPEFAAQRSAQCLWDLVSERCYRPYYHITDEYQHTAIARNLAEWIEK